MTSHFGAPLRRLDEGACGMLVELRTDAADLGLRRSSTEAPLLAQAPDELIADHIAFALEALEQSAE